MGKIENIIPLLLFNGFFILFIAGIITFIKQYKLKKKEHTAMLQFQKQEYQKELLATQLEVQQQTMQHIGREIHDNIGQKLTLASLYTQQLAYENKAPHINESIENISTIINQSLSELRELSKSLTDNTIEKSAISQLLKLEADKINELKICNVKFENATQSLQLSYQTKTVLLRITQEFIQNSIKHSHCKNISILLSSTSNSAKLELKDDGKGFEISTTKSNGIGLNNMKKRAEMINGKYQFESNKNGTKLTIEIPI
ncbi:sensor histidine kinase [Flavobacterium sp.]|uniref:sensor histidine kinase n=1 Tax=Flavobacterium sp. TaxID=239 RepID=UPI003751604D